MKKKIFISVILIIIIPSLIFFIYNIVNKNAVAREDIMKEKTENEKTENIIADSNIITEVVDEILTVETNVENVSEEISKDIADIPAKTLEPITIENGSGESVEKVIVTETPKKDPVISKETTPPSTINTTPQTEEKTPPKVEETITESKENTVEQNKPEGTVIEKQETPKKEIPKQETPSVPKEQYIRNDEMIEKIRTVIENNVTEDMKTYGYTIVIDSSIKNLTNQFTFTENRVKSAITLKFGTIRIYAEDYYCNGQLIMTECYII